MKDKKITNKEKSVFESKIKKDKTMKNTINIFQAKKVDKQIKENIFSREVNFKIDYYKKRFANFDEKNINNKSDNGNVQNKNNYNEINIYKNKIRLNKFKYENKTKKLFYLYFIFLIQLFLKIYNSSKIELTISGPGTSKIFNDKGLTSFPQTNFPIEVYINNISQPNIYSEYDFDYPENNVTLFYDLVNTMDCMFCYCSNITKIDLTNFDSSEVTIMNSTFKNCTSLIEINFLNFDTSKVTNMTRMFNYCIKLEYVDLSNFNMSISKDIRFMFTH